MALTKLFISITDNGTGTGGTSASFDSTGYTHIVVYSKYESGGTTTTTISDNKSTTGWASLTEAYNATGDVATRLTWAQIGSPGTGHTVTLTLGASRVGVRHGIWLINAPGAIELDVQSTGTGNSTACDAGSLVTTAATVSFMGVGETDTVTYTAGGGFTEDADASSYMGSRSDATSGTYDPTATATSTMQFAAVAASFKEAAGGGGTTLWAQSLL